MRFDRKIGNSTSFEFLNKEQFSEYSASGITAMELSVDAEYYELLNIKNIAKDALSEGIDLWSFHLPYYNFRGAEIAKIDQAERRFSVEFHSEWIKRAAEAGFKHAVIHPSGEPIEEMTRAEQLKAARDSIAELSLIAKNNGIQLAVENLLRTCLANCSTELLELLEDAPDAGICLDVNHVLKESIVDFIYAVKDRIITLHMSDYDGIDEKHWLPGEGIIDWNSFLDELDLINYNGVLMYEINRGSTPTIERDHVLTAEEIAQNARELVNRKPLTKRGIILV